MRKVRLVCLVLMLVIVGLFSLVPSAYAAPPTVGPCQIFPADNPWNTDISAAPVHPNSANYIANIMANGGSNVHPDFGSDPSYGIPYTTVSGTQPKVPVTFTYDDESDPGPYPIPPNAPVEGGGDRHVIVIDTDNCILYETFASQYVGGAQQAWSADSGAIFSLNSNALRPDGWTSADAAGLPIFPGLARCAEAESGTITHALRFTVRRTQKAYIYPATHYASSLTDTNYPPMGLRLRLKASYNLSGFSGQALAIAQALKTYGMILADNGSNWYISGERDQGCWNDNNLNQLKGIPGTAFEVIQSPAPPTVIIYPPSLSTPVDGASTSSARPTLIWNTVTSAVSYEVQLGTYNPPTDTAAMVSSTSPTTYTPQIPLLSGATYYWRVRAIDSAAAPTGWSPVRSFTVASPAGAAPSRSRFTVNTPVLAWNRVSWAAGYELQVSSNTTFSSIAYQNDALSGASLFDTTSTLGNGLYYWRVRAKKPDGTWGAWSAVNSFIVDAP